MAVTALHQLSGSRASCWLLRGALTTLFSSVQSSIIALDVVMRSHFKACLECP